MVFITEDLIRKRAEHNECEISTLEEISLHQCDVERIEYLDKWCRQLKILYLQANLIPKIENISRLKKLEYLNLALNNITLVENLEGCESLNKLDLTVNFIGKVTSIECLRGNQFLHDLYLTGNPCTDFVGYQDYVIAALPQLTHLDGVEINKSARILAVQKFSSLKCEILRQEKLYEEKRSREKMDHNNEGKAGFNKEWYTNTQNAHMEKNGDKKQDTTEDDFWSRPTAYTPESRMETHRYMEEKKKEKEEEKSKYLDPNPKKREIRYFTDDGRPLNINQAQMDFHLEDDDENGCYILTVSCYKHLDTSLIDVDVQPTYVRVNIKGKVFQLAFIEEVGPDASSAQRSQTTGHLVLTLPKLKYILDSSLKKTKNTGSKKMELNTGKKSDTLKSDVKDATKRIEKLEVNECDSKVDIHNIVQDEACEINGFNSKLYTKRKNNIQRENDIKIKAEEQFVDDPDVPPLM